MKKIYLGLAIVASLFILSPVFASDDHRHRGGNDQKGGQRGHNQVAPKMEQKKPSPKESPAKSNSSHRDHYRHGCGGTYWSFDLGPVHFYHGPRPYYYYDWSSSYYSYYYGTHYYYDYSCCDPCPYHRYHHYGRCEYGVDECGDMYLLHFYR